MPPKARFTKEEIISAALALVREKGAEALTARTLGARLGSSAQPVFTVFGSMEEVWRAVRAAARAVYATYVEEGLTEQPPFKGVGTQYIRFAIREPRLFSLLFMTGREEAPDISGILPAIEDHYERILASISESYRLSRADAERLYRHLWIYTHGIATLCVAGMCQFTAEQISGMLTEVCTALCRTIGKGETEK